MDFICRKIYIMIGKLQIKCKGCNFKWLWHHRRFSYPSCTKKGMRMFLYVIPKLLDKGNRADRWRVIHFVFLKTPRCFKWSETTWMAVSHCGEVKSAREVGSNTPTLSRENISSLFSLPSTILHCLSPGTFDECLTYSLPYLYPYP